MKITMHTLGSDTFRQSSFLVFGEPKAGKTSLPRTWLPLLRKDASGQPDQSRILFLDADDGLASLADLPGIRVIRLFKDATPSQVLLALQGQDKDNPELEASNFDLIVVDGLDRVGQEVMTRIEAAEAKKPKQDGFAVWREFGNAMRTWVRSMVKLDGPSKLFLTHVDFDKENDIPYVPSFPGGKVKTELIGYFDYVLFLKIDRLDPKKPPERIFITTRDIAAGGDPKYEVGNRVPITRPALPGKMKADLSLVWNTLFPPTTKETV